MKKYKKGIAFGTWDCLHFGHIKFLKTAKLQCEKLIVAIDTVEYAENVKGKDLYHDFCLRDTYISELNCVDITIPQSERFNKEKSIKSFRPDVIFVGTDHENNGWDGEKVAKKLGIDIVYIPEAEIHSEDIRKIIRK